MAATAGPSGCSTAFTSVAVVFLVIVPSYPSLQEAHRLAGESHPHKGRETAMNDERKTQDEHDEDEAAHCRQCGDPITGSDQFCAGCGAPASEAPDHPKED
jgi:rubrerythrin